MSIIHIYCGEGKGKTTCAVGLAVRAKGADKNVLFVQFLKDGSSSEIATLDKIGVDTMADSSFQGFFPFFSDKEKDEKRKNCVLLLENSFSEAKKYDLIILDEVLSACECGALDETLLLEKLETECGNTDIVMTGSNPTEKIIQKADYITEMAKVRHPYDKGLEARKGIEY